ncbi:ArsR/SmtB family transcription factor [Demequina silvatica]|uniref:ArsR/SmtB family transcription factor n=1 Tax=Demequina silvatica TaxID=1638988 RepID=UPI000782534E|nr:metalloregulator ArsR/SmtB family transcription factor [Demequina silvatica]
MTTATLASGTSHVEALARIGHALSDPTRARMLLALRAGHVSPSELADALGASRQSVSNHLACLRGCGLVVADRHGRRVDYALADAALVHALDDLMGLARILDPTCCTGATCTCA